MPRAPASRADVGLGLRVKTGRAIAVAVERTAAGPVALERRQLVLHDPAVPDSFQPYHAVLGEESQARAEATVQQLTAVVHAACASALDGWLRDLDQLGKRPSRVALVVASLTDPATVRSAHMHAHAAEGRLFLDAARAQCERAGLAHVALLAKEVPATAARDLGLAASAVAGWLAQMGKALGPPWRSDEKAAALGAWLVSRAR